MKILITGAGLIGCHAAKRLLEKGHEVVLYDVAPNAQYIKSIIGEAQGLAVEAADVRDLATLMTVLRRYGSDTVVHTAGLIGNKVEERPYTGFAINVQGSVHVAEAVRILGLKRLIFMSSFGVYNRNIPAQAPLTEDFPLGGSKKGLYLASKIADEQLLGALADLAGFELVVLRPAACFGRGHYQGGSKVGTVMHGLLQGAKSNETVRVAESLLGVNEYIYVQDLAQALEKACTSTAPPSRVFNVGMGVLYTAREVVALVCKLVPGARVELTPLGPGEKLLSHLNLDRPMDISRARAELGYAPQFDLEKALVDYLG